MRYAYNEVVMVLGAVLLGLMVCPETVCGPPPPAPVHPAEPDTHPEQVRALMRAFERLRGHAPMFLTDDGKILRPSMSSRALRRRLRETNGILRVLYGRCTSHSTTCPWAEVSINLDAERIEDTGGKLEDARRTVELAHYRVFQMTDEAQHEQEWLVWIQPEPTQPIAAEVWIAGTLGLERAALGALPIRRIEAALSDARPKRPLSAT